MTRVARQSIDEARALLAEAEALVVTAGAGMGVDSGLPDFRGKEGFWNAYPQFRRLGLNFSELARPIWFERDPRLAWGFYGHRLNLYRKTQPHSGFGLLLSFMDHCPRGGFVFTSNVDGQFQRAGFSGDRIVECHGSIHRLQRIDDQWFPTWDGSGIDVRVDEVTMRAVGDLPVEPSSGVLARPNILMFHDTLWNPTVTEAQQRRYSEWLASLRGARLLVIEVGAGVVVPTVRWHSEHLVSNHGARLIRINPRDWEVPGGQIGLPCGALEGLSLLFSKGPWQRRR